MKKLFIICSLILAAAFFTRCEKETLTLPENVIEQNTVKENYNTKLERFNQMMINNPSLKEKRQLAARESFMYLSPLCGETILAETIFATEGYQSDYDYYYFFGLEGDEISIFVERTSAGMDPTLRLYFGYKDDTNFDLTGLEYFGFWDDDVPDPFFGCYGDPQLLETLPYTGRYTIAISNWGDCDDGTGPYTYKIITTGISCGDIDEDGVLDYEDNCPLTPNADQTDTDADSVGDDCDVCAGSDDTLDYDDDGTPDGCDLDDYDQDGFFDYEDNCPLTANVDQADYDGDGIGDVCDNCLYASNANQADNDGDGIGDNCDNCLGTSNVDQADTDGDGIGDVCDNCPNTSNVDQADYDWDGIGDVCDNCPDISNTNQTDTDNDGLGDVCDDDIDGDGDLNINDNCPNTPNADQANNDSDSQGDVCDTDDDNDGCLDSNDSIDFSNMEATVYIEACNTGVTNKVTSTCGIMMSDRIDALEDGTYTKRDTFIKAITKVTTEWQRAGFITMAEKNLILKCARKASY